MTFEQLVPTLLAGGLACRNAGLPGERRIYLAGDRVVDDRGATYALTRADLAATDWGVVDVVVAPRANIAVRDATTGDTLPE